MTEINLEDRFKGPFATNGIFKNVFMVIDATDCPIDKPSASKEERLLYYCGRNKDSSYSKYNVKYNIGVQIGTGRIVCILGPEPGSVHDLTALRRTELIGFLFESSPFEIILADKGYTGEQIILVPFKAARGRGRWRSAPGKHKMVFNVCAQITNISLERETVWLHVNNYLE